MAAEVAYLPLAVFLYVVAEAVLIAPCVSCVVMWPQDPNASEMFQLVRTAYEILKDEEERQNYDYMLENPGDHVIHVLWTLASS